VADLGQVCEQLGRVFAVNFNVEVLASATRAAALVSIVAAHVKGRRHFVISLASTALYAV